MFRYLNPIDGAVNGQDRYFDKPVNLKILILNGQDRSFNKAINLKTYKSKSKTWRVECKKTQNNKWSSCSFKEQISLGTVARQQQHLKFCSVGKSQEEGKRPFPGLVTSLEKSEANKR